MPDTKNEEDQDRGDEVLKRMLKTPPTAHDSQKLNYSPPKKSGDKDERKQASPSGKN